MSVLLAHPGVGPFVRANVEALAERGLLDRFATTVVDDPDCGWQRLIALGGPVTRSVRGLMNRRKPPHIGRDKIVTRPFRELVRASISRIDSSGVWTDRAWDWMSHDFTAWAGRCISARTRAVFASEYNALEMFVAAQARSLPRILELPSAEHDFVASIIATERKRAGCSEPDAYARHTGDLRARRTARRRREVELATLVIVNSPFSRESYARAGYPMERFIVLPLGAPELRDAGALPAIRRTGPLRLVWGGNFAWHKGAALLVDALAPFMDRTDLELDVYGEIQLPDTLMARLPRWVRLHGAVPREEFLHALTVSDALLHPSLSDGFAMVVSEAMALGVAPVVSTATGASALVTHGQSGRVIAAGDIDSLREAIAWCIDNRDALPLLGASAHAAASRWTWRDYRREFAEIVGAHVGP